MCPNRIGGARYGLEEQSRFAVLDALAKTITVAWSRSEVTAKHTHRFHFLLWPFCQLISIILCVRWRECAGGAPSEDMWRSHSKLDGSVLFQTSTWCGQDLCCLQMISQRHQHCWMSCYLLYQTGGPELPSDPVLDLDMLSYCVLCVYKVYKTLILP